MDQFLTVQETLQKASHKKIIKMYINQKLPQLNTKEEKKKAKKQLKKYIKYLLSLKVQRNQEQMIFYVSHDLELDAISPQPFFNLQKLDQLGSNYSNYGCEFAPFTETLGYYVANTWRTKKYLNELLVDILFNMSWTGYKQENLSDIEKDLKISLNENPDKDITIFSKKELYNFLDLDITKDDYFDRYEWQLSHKINHLMADLHNHSVNREASKIKSQL